MPTNEKLRPDEASEKLYSAILSLRSAEECRSFFSDLLTPQELLTLAQRLEVAQMLCDGCTYEKIRTRVSASSSTITRVSTELQYGAGGYRLVLDRLAQMGADEENIKKE